MQIWKKNPSSLPRTNYGGKGKRLFIGLLCASCVVLGFLIVLAWFIPYIGLSGIHPILPYILGGISIFLILCLLWISVALSYHVYTGKMLWGIKTLRSLNVKLIFPLMEILGRCIGISREHIRLSFVKVNNEMVLGSKIKVKANKLLVLLPHCIQNSRCAHRLTFSIDNCQRCGICTLGALLDLRDKLGFTLVIATGGTIARRIVVQTRPHFIIAVACERDLTSGIQDSYPLPVYGIINERPCGPCIDTSVNVQLLSNALDLFLDKSTNHGQDKN